MILFVLQNLSRKLIIVSFSVIQQEVSSLETKYVFGASIDLDLLGIEIDEKTLIPGLAVASSRAKALAGTSMYPFEYLQLGSIIYMTAMLHNISFILH